MQIRLGLFFFLISFYGFSQMTTKQGPWVELKSKATHQGFVMTDSNYVYAIDFMRNNLRQEQKLFVNVYDKKTLDFHNKLDISPTPREGVEIELTEIFSIRQTMIIVMVETLESEQKRIVLQSINSEGKRGVEIIVDTLPSEKNVNDDFEIVVDKEESSFAICINYPVSRNENQKLKITTFDSDLKFKWTKVVEFPQKEKQFIFSDWRYDGDQQVYFLARYIIDLYQPEYEFTNLNQNTYYLWGYDHQKDKLKEIELSLNQRFINKISMQIDSSRWLICGIYANDKKFHSDGVFSLILDKQMKVTSHNLHDFTVEEKRSFHLLTSEKTDKKGFDDVQLKSIEVMQNGDLVLVGEEFRKEVELANDGRMNSVNLTELYYYENIALFWLNNTGVLNGIYTIPKNQISINDQGYFSSYQLAKTEDNLFVFYNDSPRNLNPNGNYVNQLKPVNAMRKMYVKGVQIDRKGIQRQEVITPPSSRHRVRPSIAGQLLDQSFYLLSQKRKSRALFKVEF
jgi:hypothetical protein